jgi:hypothetical protein
VITRRFNSPLLIAVLLAALMAATRYHHFGSSTYLPDASFAVFLLAGFYVRSPWAPVLLLIEAALIDSVTIAGGVSAFCVTPAYAFLIPAYGALWLGGRIYSRLHRWAWPTLLPLSAVVLVSVTLALLISSGSFYLFSGYFPEMNALEYADRVAKYFPAYLASTCLYVAIAAGVQTAVRTGVIPTRHGTGVGGAGPR